MATVPTLLDIAKANGRDMVVDLIDETQKAHPEIKAVAARTIKGISYKTWIRKTLPATGFRQANQGGIVDHSGYEDRLVDTFLFNPRVEADVAVADAFEDGAAAWLAYELEGTMESSLQVLCKQFYYGPTAATTGPTGALVNPTGIAGDALGFPGLINAVSSAYVYDAGGTTANTGSSVWGVKTGEKFVQWVWGNNGQLEPSDLVRQRVTDANGKPYTAYIQEILARPGLQIGSLRGVGRIKKITADSGCTLTDAKLAAWLALFEVGFLPDVIFMNRTARSQLQQSRTVTLFGQAGAKLKGDIGTVAPIPTEYDGIPIMVTDALVGTEALN